MKIVKPGVLTLTSDELNINGFHFSAFKTREERRQAGIETIRWAISELERRMAEIEKGEPITVDGELEE